MSVDISINQIIIRTCIAREIPVDFIASLFCDNTKYYKGSVTFLKRSNISYKLTRNGHIFVYMPKEGFTQCNILNYVKRIIENLNYMYELLLENRISSRVEFHFSNCQVTLSINTILDFASFSTALVDELKHCCTVKIRFDRSSDSEWRAYTVNEPNFCSVKFIMLQTNSILKVESNFKCSAVINKPFDLSIYVSHIENSISK